MASYANTFIDGSLNCTFDISSSAGITNSDLTLSWYRDDLEGKDYCVVQFKTIGKTYEWVTPGLVSSIDILLIGGGGRGGRGNWYGGGGGAGGFIETNTAVVPTYTYQISVGKGATYSPSANSENSTFSYNSSNIFTALGGGNGAGLAGNATTGGSGGGSSNNGNAALASDPTQGNSGGGCCGDAASPPGVGSGGGGAGGSGSSGTPNGNGGAGGAGKSSTITGTIATFAGGGGGIKNQDGASTGSGGLGGGGSAASGRGTAVGQAGQVNTGSGGGASSNQYSNAVPGDGGTGIVIIRYEIDLTAPSLSATSFTVNENLSAPYTAATITLSESSTISTVSGADSASFTLLFPDSTTVVINFNAPPDFEIPIASGGGNDYQISFIATDLAGNGTSAQLITITVSDVLDTSAFNGLSLAGAATSASYRTAILITADISVASKVTFKLNGKVIPGCKRRLATGSESSFTVTCNWRPSMRGSVTLVATANPIASGIPNATASPVKVFVNKRTGLRGG